MSEAELMPMDFNPVRTGRKRLVDAEPLMDALAKHADEGHEGRWLSYSTYSVQEVRSLYTQLKNAGYEVRTGNSGKVLYVAVPKAAA